MFVLKKMPTKIIVLGDCGCGKSSLVHRFCFPSDTPHVSKTLAIDCTSRLLKFSNKLYKIQFWDIAGGAEWRSLYPQYIYNADMAMVVYDVTNRLSFENIEIWINMIRKIRGKKFPIMVVANKIDKESERIVNSKTYAAFDNIFLIETSAKLGIHCREALQIILSQTKEVMTTTVEKPWYYKLIGL